MSGKANGGETARRRTDRALVATYHEAELAGLIEHVTEAIERYRAGELDAYGVDEVVHRYHNAARELWKFCFSRGSGAHVETLARLLEERTAAGDRPDWWASVKPRRD